MSDNPFAPPESNVQIAGRPVAGSVGKAVAVGATVDIIGTIIIGVVLIFAYAAMNGSPNMRIEDWYALVERMEAELTNFQSIWAIVTTVLGLVMSIVGGYLCARIAKTGWRRANTILALVMIIFGLLMSLELYSPAMHFLWASVTAVAVFTGGLLWARTGGEPLPR